MSEARKLLPNQGPRHRKERVKTTSRTFYDRYCLSASNPLSFADWREVIEKFNEKVMREIIDNRNGVSLPHWLGTLMIASVEPSRKPWRVAINFNADKEKEVQLPNLETGGLQCKILYTTYDLKYLREERQLWAFKGCRKFTRTLSKRYRTDWEKYVYLSRTGKISNEFLAYSREKRASYIDKEKYDPLQV